MTRRALGLAGGWIVCLATTANAQSQAQVTLQGRGLERSGATFVHSSEAAALAKVDELKEAYKRLTAARYKLAEAEMNTEVIAELNMQAAYLKQEQAAINAQSRNMPRMPRGAGNMMRQNIAAEQQQEQMAINQTNQQLAAMKKAAPTPQARKGMEDDVAKRKEEAAQAATEARKLVDETNAAYEGLAKDETVKTALAAVKKTTTDALKLGPSKDFLTAVKSLDTAERLLSLKAPAATKKATHKAKAKH